MLIIRTSTGARRLWIILAVWAALLSQLIVGCAALERRAAVPSNLISMCAKDVVLGGIL